MLFVTHMNHIIHRHSSLLLLLFMHVDNDEQHDAIACAIACAIASCYSFEAADGTSRHDGRLANVYTPKGS